MKIILLVLFVATASVVANAQSNNILSTQNDSIRIDVLAESGQFQIKKTGNGDPLSYSGINQWNSYTTFYYTNSTNNNFWPTNMSQKISSGSPTLYAGPQSVFTAADSCYLIGDTVRTVWNNIGSFIVTQDLFPIMTSGGGQAVIKYSVMSTSATTGYIFRGIFLMIDIAVTPPTISDQCGLDEDKPLVLTSLNYNATATGGDAGSICWQGRVHHYTDSTVSTGPTGIPDFFIAGRRFSDFGPPKSLIGKGNLTGPGLRAPNEFMVADWLVFNDTTWDFSKSITNIQDNSKASYSDAAVGYKWKMSLVNLTKPYVVATAYGMNDFDGQYNLCPGADPMFLISSVSPRHHYRAADGTLDSLTTWVKVWVANTDHALRPASNDNVTIDLSAAPDLFNPSQLTQPAIISTIPPTSSNTIGGSNVGSATWVLTLDTSKTTSAQDYDEVISFHNTSSNTALNCDCSQLLTTTFHSSPQDVTPPVVAVQSSTRYKTIWTLSDNQQYDTGIDSVVVTDSANYSPIALTNFVKCSPASQPQYGAQVRDTTKDAHFVFTVFDCHGNSTSDSTAFTAIKTGVADGAALPDQLTMHSYPNPFSDATEVLINGPASRMITGFHLYSSIGTDVTASANLGITDIGDSRHVRINGHSLTPGMYTVVALTARGALRQTIMLMR